MLKKLITVVSILLAAVALYAQDIHVRVLDANNQPVPGATVFVKGSSIGTSADATGSCFLKNLGKDDVLTVACIGYEDAQVTVGSRSEIVVNLKDSNLYLNDVIVVGYGTQRRKDLSGSIAKVNGDKVREYNTFSAAAALTGKVAGVQVYSADGTPGGSIQVRVRGTNSLKGSNEPLWVINGFPGDINMINTEDIESIEILKDASATAIYGSRGANGVIIVTTKKAKEGKVRVAYNGSIGFQKPVDKIEMCNAKEYMDFYNQYAEINGTPIAYTEEQIRNNKYDTKWLNEATRTAPITSHGVDIAGGNEKVQANLGVSYFGQDGILLNTNYKRFNIRSEVNYNISKYVSANAKIIYSNVDQMKMTSTGVNSACDHIYTASPVASPYNEDGSYNLMLKERTGVNPVKTFMTANHEFSCNRIQIEGGVTIRPFHGLSIILTDAYYIKDSRNDDFVSSLASGGDHSTSTASISVSGNKHFVSNNIIQYDNNFGKHNVNLMTGVTYEQDVTKGVGTGTATGFMSDILETYAIQAATKTTGLPSSSFTDWRLFSYIARANYNYDNKYYFTASFRADGSSRYSKGNKWGYFPSAAVAWKISEEDFMDNASWIDELKLRASFGMTGSTAIDPYATSGSLTTYTAVFDGNTTTCYATPDTYNGMLKWETTAQADAGIDFSAFNNRLRVVADYYYKKTTDLLNDVEMPRSSGYTKSLRNIGSLQNQGFELSVDGLIIDSEVKWNMGVNFSLNRSKVLSLGNNNADIFGDSINCTLFNGQIHLVRVGEPLFVFYGYREDGYTENGNFKYKNIDGDPEGKITAADREIIGNPNPDFSLGLSTSVSWKGFTLSAAFDGTFGNDMFSIPACLLNFFYTEGHNVTKDMYQNHWTPQNTNAKYPNALAKLDFKVSDRYVMDASYLKCRNIELAYDIPMKKGSAISGLNVYVSAQNLFTITKYPYADPSANVYAGSSSFRQGVDYFSYPFCKSATLGCRISF